MINATKAEVDEACGVLADRLEDLAYAIQAWQANPTDSRCCRVASTALETAERAFGEYQAQLTTWAAGPNGGNCDG